MNESQESSLQRRHFELVSNRYDARYITKPPIHTTKELETMKRILNMKPGSVLLDFGSGNGRVALYFLSLGYNVIAVDISKLSLKQLERMYARYKTHSWGKLLTRTSLPKDSSVDGIIGADILHHVNIRKELPRLFRVLRPHGKMVISEPNGWNIFWYLYIVLRRLPWSVERGIVHCNAPNLIRQCVYAGFHTIRIRALGFLFPGILSGRLHSCTPCGFRLIVSAEKGTAAPIVQRSKILPLIGTLLLVLIPVLIRLWAYQPLRMHGDDLLTASFSLALRPRTTNFFAGVPADKTAWVAQFPAPYFFLQKLFLRIFDLSITTVKWSILPYVFVVSFFTYQITLLLFGNIAAAIAMLLYAFMAISIYFETLGLHFVSSTAVFMVFFYSLLRARRSTRRAWHLLCGMGCGACYLSYPSSYIALPIFAVTLIVNRLRNKRASLWRFAGWFILGCTTVLAPFIIYAATADNYFFGRIGQVALLGGSWSDKHGIRAVWENALLALRSFYTNGIGGHGGYTFNHQAFFPPSGLILFLCGVVFLFFQKHRFASLLVLFIILVSFITGVILTIPPPAYHRFSLAFPFIAVVSSSPFGLIKRVKHKMLATLTYCATVAIILIYAQTNVAYAQTAMESEALPIHAIVIRYVNTQFPNRHVHIAAFPGYALERFFPFFPPVTTLSLDTQYHATYLEHFNRKEPYVYIIIFPEAFGDKFMQADPQATYIPFSDTYGILVNHVENGK